MGFSTDLQDAFSHEALVSLQEAELRLLENMKKCIILRAKCDRDYAASLTMVSAQAQKLDQSKELEGSSIARVSICFLHGILLCMMLDICMEDLLCT